MWSRFHGLSGESSNGSFKEEIQKEVPVEEEADDKRG